MPGTPETGLHTYTQENLLKTTPPNTFNVWGYCSCKKLSRTRKWQGWKLHLETCPKGLFHWYQDSSFQDLQCSSTVFTHPIMWIYFFQIGFTESKTQKSESPIWTPTFFLKENKTPPRSLSKIWHHHFNTKLFPVVNHFYPQVPSQLFYLLYTLWL